MLLIKVKLVNFNRFCTDADRRLGSLDDIRNHPFFLGVDWDHIRDRPAAYQPRVKSIDDTSNFDEFPDVDLKLRKLNLCLIISLKSITIQFKPDPTICLN